MDFCHLIVTCLFSMLRLPFDNQKVKGNYAIFSKNIKVFLQHSVRAAYFLMYVRIGIHIRQHKPTHIYVSGYTYIRIGLYVRTHQDSLIIYNKYICQIALLWRLTHLSAFTAKR